MSGPDDLEIPEIPDVDLGGVDMDLDPSLFGTPSDFDADLEPRYVRPPLPHSVKEEYLAYEGARRLARAVDLDFGARTFARCRQLHLRRLHRSPTGGKELPGHRDDAVHPEHEREQRRQPRHHDGEGLPAGLPPIISSYFFSHERHNLIPYIYKRLDQGDRFQLAVAGTHAKTCIFETDCGRKVVIHGSANLRSSGNIEQVMVEENPMLYDFNKAYQDRILDRYSTIRKEIRGKELWHQVARKRALSSTGAPAGKGSPAKARSVSTPARSAGGSKPKSSCPTAARETPSGISDQEKMHE
jgi:hypothetical protein